MKWTVKTNLFAFLLFVIPCLLQANEVTQNYIQQYKHIAINEMNRVGIPASIKMAQAILESSSGKSTLSRQSNNHFGIKCGRDWTGGEVYREDDDYENGLLVRSCFRAYEDPAESFMAHSDFLANPKSQRYKFLFDLDRYDYKAWAHGLKKAGYATDPKYPSKLISIIEKYELYLLDNGIVEETYPDVLASVETPVNDNHTETQSAPSFIIIQSNTSEEQSNSTDITNHSSSKRYSNNGVYVFQNGDRMIDVARKFNMSLQELQMRNRIPSGSKPVVGQSLAINSYVHLKKAPAFVDANQTASEETYLWEEEFVISGI